MLSTIGAFAILLGVLFAAIGIAASRNRNYLLRNGLPTGGRASDFCVDFLAPIGLIVLCVGIGLLTLGAAAGRNG